MIQKVKNCLFTGIAADAFGHRFVQEDLPTGQEKWRFSQTSHYLTATCLSILDRQEVDPVAIGNRMSHYYREQQLSGLSGDTLRILTDLVDGEHWEGVGSQGDEMGNGSLLRIAPLAFVLDVPGNEADREKLDAIVQLSHQEKTVRDAALAFVLAIRYFQNDHANAIDQLVRNLPEGKIRDRIREMSQFNGQRIRKVGRELGVEKSVTESLPFALFAAWQGLGKGVLHTLREVVAAGGDTHGNCALTGYLLGVQSDTLQIPEEWTQPLQEIDEWDEMQSVYRRFAEYAAASSGIQSLF